MFNDPVYKNTNLFTGENINSILQSCKNPDHEHASLKVESEIVSRRQASMTLPVGTKSTAIPESSYWRIAMYGIASRK